MKYLSLALVTFLFVATVKNCVAQTVITPNVISFEGKVGIGTSTPAAPLDVVGNVKITDGSQGIDKVLTSDSAGVASWQTPKPTFYKAGAGITINGDTISTASPDVTALQAKVDVQEQEIANLKNTIAQMQIAMSECCNSFSNSIEQQQGSGITQTDVPQLEQNVPNPFNQNSYVKYYLPSTAQTGIIIITDLTGRVLKEFDGLATGYNQVNINAGDLVSGTYQYSLYVDGVRIDTKQMVLTK